MERVFKIIALIVIAAAGSLSVSGKNYIVSADSMHGTNYMACVDSADYYIKKELWQDAEYFTLKALKTEPGNSANWLLWSNLGEIRMRLGKYRRCL